MVIFPLEVSVASDRDKISERESKSGFGKSVSGELKSSLRRIQYNADVALVVNLWSRWAGVQESKQACSAYNFPCTSTNVPLVLVI
jgi:hypothetical protein